MSEVVEQEPVEEDVATPNFTQEDTASAIIQKTRIVPRYRPTAPEENTQNVVAQPGQSAFVQSRQQSYTQSYREPDAHNLRPVPSSKDQPTANSDAYSGAESKYETIKHRMTDALIGSHALLILDGFTRYPLKNANQKPIAQSKDQPKDQPKNQPGYLVFKQPDY
jgi:hypothetical protein